MPKAKIKIDDIILEAFFECLNDDFIKSRKETKNSGETVYNKHYWEMPQFVSLDYIDQNNNIIYKKTQAGTDPSSPNHIIGIAFPYCEYKPFHDKYLKNQNRSKTTDKILNS